MKSARIRPTHPFLTRLSAAQAREEIAGNKKKLEDRFSRPVRHFCFPYGDWNPAVRDLVAAAGRWGKSLWSRPGKPVSRLPQVRRC
jgi:peptidoglycan/xylan/chitin deacetylase (PgdA/CDA1 family)